jgi:hypothetical protein
VTLSWLSLCFDVEKSRKVFNFVVQEDNEFDGKSVKNICEIMLN